MTRSLLQRSTPFSESITHVPNKGSNRDQGANRSGLAMSWEPSPRFQKIENTKGIRNGRMKFAVKVRKHKGEERNCLSERRKTTQYLWLLSNGSARARTHTQEERDKVRFNCLP